MELEAEKGKTDWASGWSSGRRGLKAAGVKGQGSGHLKTHKWMVSEYLGTAGP